MRKFLALAVCWILAFSAGYMILPSSATGLINWLSPVFGTSLHVTLSTLFLLFGDPLVYTSLALAWGIVGFVGGFIIRKRLGSVLTMPTIYGGQSLVFSLAGFRLFQVVSAMELPSSLQDAMTFLPPVPEGTTLATILEAPIIGDIFSNLDLTALQSFDVTAITDLAVNVIAVNAIKNLAILVVASLIGCEVGLFLSKHLGRRIVLIGRTPSTPGNPSTPTTHRHSTRSRRVLGIVALLLVAVVAAPLLPAHAATPGYYSETLMGTVTPNGTAIAGAVFLDTEYLLNDVNLQDAGFADCAAMALLTHQLDVAALQTDLSFVLAAIAVPEAFPVNLEDLVPAYNLAPQTVLLLVYRGLSLSVASSRATTAVTRVSAVYGISFTQLVSVEQPLDEDSLAIFVYQSTAEFTTVGPSILATLPEAERGGLAAYLGSVYRSGVLTPGVTAASANGTLIVTGFVNPATLRSAMDAGAPTGETVFLPDLSAPVPFLGVASYFSGMFHSSPIVVHALTFSALFQTTAPITFSPDSNASNIIAVIPMGNTTDPLQLAAPIISIVTSLPAANLTDFLSPLIEGLTGIDLPEVGDIPPELLSLNVTVYDLGVTIDEDAITITFLQQFPLQLQVRKTVSEAIVDRHQVVTVTVTVVNNDTEAAYDVTVDDSTALAYYTQGAQLIEGNLTAHWEVVPNRTATDPSTRSMTYRVQLDKEGVYTFPSAVVFYTYGNTTRVAVSNTAAVTVRSPNVGELFAEGLPIAWDMAVELLDMVPGFQGNGTLLLTLIVATVAALTAFSLFRDYRRWRGGIVVPG
jgi:hypothetical protein